MFDSNQFFSGGAAGFYPLTIDQSLRFYNNAYLTNTMSSASGTYTVSVWLKRAIITSSGYQYIWSSGAAGLAIGSTAGSVDQFYVYDGSTVQYATPKYRDPSAWYHLVLSVSSNTGVLYVNGESVKTGISCASLSTSANASRIGTYGGGTALPLDGYLAEFHFTDGTAYDADAFGELKSGVWVAKSPSVTYGTNGFYLDFANSADIGNDVSGEGNDWTPNFFTASDVVLDSPTDNFATLNPLSLFSPATLSNGNLDVNTGTTAYGFAYGTIAIPTSGKWYWEYTPTSNGNQSFCGVSVYQSGAPTNSLAYYAGTGEKYVNNSNSAYGATYTDNDVIGVAVDVDAGTVTFYKNNSSQGSITYATSSGSYFPWFTDGTGATGTAISVNFGQLGFTYTPPTGYLALSTANLPDPVIDPAQDASPEDYFNTVLYTGNGSSQSITGVGFSPDFLWLKERSSTSHHQLFHDIGGGTPKFMQSSSTIAEVTDANVVSSFDADGFSVGSSGGSNQSGQTYVGWNWYTGGNQVTNTDGSITSTVSANTTSGFSIVSYSGNDTAGATVGHGLSQAPEMIIVKHRNSASFNWIVYHASVSSAPETDYLSLNLTSAVADLNTVWNDTAPTSSVFSLGTSNAVNDLNEPYIAYCFHSVEGFSKFGSYVGNGSADGPFVYTGFRPAFVMVKGSSFVSPWTIHDSERNTYNVVDKNLTANTSNAEGTYAIIDFTSNGFKLRNTGANLNSSGQTFIYMAFAENPFKYSNAR